MLQLGRSRIALRCERKSKDEKEMPTRLGKAFCDIHRLGWSVL